MELFLIRHAESVPNVEPIIGGMRGDAGLTELGRQQGELLERRLRDEDFRADQLYASTLPRARETAQYVSRALELPVQLDADLQELRPGEADGLSVAEWRARYGGFDGSMADEETFRAFAPGGESWASFLVRAGAALTRIVTRHPSETVVAVTHGGVLEASFSLAFGTGSTSDRVGLATRNTAITHWRHERAVSGRERWTLLAYNDAGHLAGVTQPARPDRDAVPTPPDNA